MSAAIEQLPVDGLVESPAPRLETRSPRPRCFVAQGVTWSVYHDRSYYVGPSLIFESSNVLRRVRGYPENWHELADDQLTRLSRAR